MRLDNGTESCDRCGMLLHTALVSFHKCNGTNMSARPANISESEWNEALMKAIGAQQVEKPKKSAVTPDQYSDSLAQHYRDIASADRHHKDTASADKAELKFQRHAFGVFLTVVVFVFFGWLAYLGGK